MVAELREKVQSASIAAEKENQRVAARLAALEARSKELDMIHVRLITCYLTSC